ncbi:hypothetical protein BB561_005763, partial [Smittium simulii]
MPKVPGVIPSAAAGLPYHSAKRTRLEYSTVAKTAKKNQKPQKTTKKFEKNKKISKKNNMITNPKLNPKIYTEVSIKHLLNGSEPQSFDKKIGCGWSQFSGDIDADIEYVSSFIVEQAIQFMKTPIFVNERRVELYQAIKPTPVVVDEINKIFSPYGTIIGFSAFKNKITSLFYTYGIKFLFKKNTEEFKIPEFIDIEDVKIALTYRGCVAACNVPGVIPSADTGYSTVAKAGYINPATKNDYKFNFSAKNNQNNQKNEKNTKNQKKNEKFEKFQQNNKNNVKKIINPAFNPQEFTEVSIMHLLDNSIPKALKKACYGGSNTKIGCSWTQFSGNINAAIDYVALKIDNEY